MLTVLSTVLYYKSSTVESETNALNTAAGYKLAVDNQLRLYRSNLERAAKKLEAAKGDTDSATLKSLADEYGYEMLYIADEQGKSANGSAADLPAFEKALNGMTYINNPVYDEAGDSLTLTVATPIENGKEVLLGILSYDTFSQVFQSIKVGDSGYAFAVSKDGKTVVHPTKDSVAHPIDYFEKVKTDKSVERIANIFTHMVKGETNVGYSIYNGVKRLVAYRPIDGPEGWSLAVTTPVTQVEQNLRLTLFSCVGAGVLVLLLASIVNLFFANKITAPILSATKRIELLTAGDLSTEVSVTRGQDEVARLNLALGNTIQWLRGLITEISTILGQISRSDLTGRGSLEYLGDFVPIKEALQTISDSLHDTFSMISETAMQVHASAEEVSVGAQNLANNSAEQAGTIEQLTGAFQKITTHVNQNASNAVEMEQLSKDTIQFVTTGNAQMEELLRSMRDIDASSTEILNVIQLINDIASQTNILALNAAVEAARAGDAGKGFAVVAGEVRKLAAKSTESAQTTTTLIEKSLNSVKAGLGIAESTAGTLQEIVDKTKRVNKLIDSITEASKQQAQAITDIETGMMSISDVTQTNSATAEESAAASYQLTNQSVMLKKLVEKFKFK